jgi:uncharacterized protein (TIGR02145 family)
MVTSKCGGTSAVSDLFTVNLCPDAQITGYNPASKSAYLIGTTPVSLTVTPNGTPANFDYQWFKGTYAAADPVGTNSQTYSATEEDTYFCIVTSKCGGVDAASDLFTITILSGAVRINGVIWATCNVGMPGTFVATPQNEGMLYQWNDKLGWGRSDDLICSDGGHYTQIPSNHSPSTTWIKDNDPCPDGWRVPTRNELQGLVDAGSTWQSSPAGRTYGSGTNTIFLPAAGMYVSPADIIGNYEYFKPDGGNYWSSTRMSGPGTYFAYHLEFGNNYNGVGSFYLSHALSVRCVKE